MAKGKEKSGLPAIALEVVGEMKLGKDDLIAVTVSREEQRLLKSQADVDSQIRRLNKDQKDGGKALTKIRQALVDGATSKDVKALEKVLKAAGFKDVEIVVSLGQDKNGQIEFDLAIKRDYHHKLSQPGSVKISAEMKKFQAEIEKRTEQVSALQTEAVEIRKRISQLGSVERAAKARFAEQLLGQTKEGRAFLDSVEGIQSLPMPKD